MFKARTTSSRPARRSKFSKRGLLLETLETRMCLAADPAFLPGEVLIQFAADASDQDRQEVRGLAQATLKQQIHTPPMRANGLGVIDRVQLPGNVPVHAAIKMFAGNPNVLVAEPNYVISTAAVSNDPGYTDGSLWGMESDDSPLNIGPSGTTNIYGSQAEEAWNQGATGSSSVFVGIIDEGFQYNHPDLIDNAWVNPVEQNGTPGVDDDGNGYVDDVYGWDFFNDDNTPYDGTGDDHGTHVAGTVGGKGGNGIGVAGVNWDVTMISAKFLGSGGGSTAGAIAAVDYITDLKTRHGIDIVATNNSWGGGGYSSLLEAAIIRGANENILFVAAAGNDATDIDGVNYYPANYSTSNPQDANNTPASYDAVIAVASITSSGALSGFSNYGATKVDIAAPGSGIYSTLPADSYGTYSGTSMATPHVAGAVALYASQHSPGSRPTGAEIRDAILGTAVPTASVSGKTVTGGRLDVNALIATANPAGLDVSIVATGNSEQLEGDAGTRTLTFEIRLDQPASDPTPIVVDYQIEFDPSGGATADDFVLGPGGGAGSVTFDDPTNPNALVKTISFQVSGDLLVEPDESFDVVIPAAPANAGLWKDRATGTILGDDASIQGFVFGDLNLNGIQDGTEGGQGGVTVYADSNSNGNLDAGEPSAVTDSSGNYQLQVDPGSHVVRLQLAASQEQTYPSPLSGALEPDSYAAGTILNNVLGPSVSLSAVGSNVANSNVTSQTQTYSSTGTRVFASTWNTGLWNTVDAELRIDFSSPVNRVSIDGISDDTSDYVHMRAYNSAGQLLQEYVTGNLGTGVAETMTINRANNEISYILAAGRNGQFAWLDNMSYSSIDDGNGAPIVVVVGPSTSTGNNFGVSAGGSPNAVDDAAATNEDNPVAIQVLANDTDPDGDPLTVTATSGVDNGSVSISSNVITFTPDADFNGVEVFSYTVSDGTGRQSSANVTVTVNPVNDTPTAGNDAYSVDENGVLSISAPGVLQNDGDIDGDNLTAVLANGVANGTLQLNGDGSFTYTPNPGYFGQDSFTYVANDGSVDSLPATVSINVVEQNEAPVAVNDAFSVGEDGFLQVTAPGLLGNDTDADGNPLTASLINGPGNGTLSLSADGSFTYTPAENFNGVDQFTYVANDGTQNSNTATVTITVDAVNDLPVAEGDSYSVDENGVLNVNAPGVLQNDSDIDGDNLSASVVSNVANGTLQVNSDGSFTYTPNPGYFGQDSFTYVANDGSSDSLPASVSITVVEQNDAPVAVNDAFSVSEDGVLQVGAPGVLGNDTDAENNPLTASLVNGPSNGTLSLSADGSFVYTPAANFNGVDEFTYIANDGNSNSNVATATITVQSVNDNPVANDDSTSTERAVAVVVDVLGNDNDADGDALSVTGVTQGNGGSVVNNGDGTVTYTPNSGFVGLDSFSYTIDDNNGGIATANVEVTVTDGAFQYRDVASGTTTIFGISDNDFSATHWADGNSQTITEESYQRSSRSRLEQEWQFDVTGGDQGVTFWATANHNSSVESFQFEYNVGGGWLPLFVLTGQSEPYSATLPTTVSGSVQVRVYDTNRSKNENSLDSIQIDEMYFLSERLTALPPRIAIEATDSDASETGPNPGEFTISLADGIAQASDIIVGYQVSGLAESSDYLEELTNSVTIKAGDLSTTILITPIDDSLQEQPEDVTLTIVEDLAYLVSAANQASVTIADNDTTEFFAISETNIYGSSSGDFTDTKIDDGVSQQLTEERYSGGSKKSRLEHRWNFDLSGLSNVDFVLDASHDSTNDPDHFVFEYSTDGGVNWLNLTTVDPSTSGPVSVPVQLGTGVGAVIVRVVDTDNSNDRSSASISIDQMLFRIANTSSTNAVDGFFAALADDDEDGFNAAGF